MGICVKHTLCYEDFDNCKTYIIFLKLFKSNKIFENPLSLRVAGSGTKKPVTTYVVSAF